MKKDYIRVIFTDKVIVNKFGIGESFRIKAVKIYMKWILIMFDPTDLMDVEKSLKVCEIRIYNIL